MEETNKMDFGYALAYLKEGKKVAREGWNGKGMYLQYVSQENYKTFGLGETKYPIALSLFSIIQYSGLDIKNQLIVSSIVNVLLSCKYSAAY